MEEDILTLETFTEEAPEQKAQQRAKCLKKALSLHPHVPTMPFSHTTFSAPSHKTAAPTTAKGIGARHRLNWQHCVKMNLVDPDVASLLTSPSLPQEESRVAPAEVILPNKTASRRKEEGKKKQTAGPNWFDMPRGDLNEANRRDLQALQIRGAMDPKQFYKKSDLGKTPPTFFQVGTVKEDATEFYSARLTKKQRKKTILEELLQDTDRRQYLKKKFLEVQHKAQAGGKKWYKKKEEKKKSVMKRSLK